MPWRESHRMNERMRFVVRLGDGEKMTDLCQEFGISRKTGYKFWERYKARGPEGLCDLSRRPIRSPRRTPMAMVELILGLKSERPTWGAPKLREYLVRKHADIQLPTVPTIHGILKRNGLVQKRKRRPRVDDLVSRSGTRQTAIPNELWCADYKGEFRMGNGQYCYPLTISDHYSRFLLGCEAMETTKFGETRAACEWVFREHGLPQAIRTDNGPPFGHPQGLFGLSRLSVWWMKLGIRIERIEPGHPEQNGRHERMHLTLKQATTRPAATNILAQQEKFDSFREEYNQDRPHEALGMETPNSVYTNSERIFPEALPEPEYPFHDETRIVRPNGQVVMHRRSESFYLAQVFAGETIGLREEDDNIWKISFLNLDLGFYDGRTRKFAPVDKLIVV